MFRTNIIKKYLLFGLFFLLANTYVFAQNASFTYQYFEEKDGLSSDLIKCVFKDSRNLLWIGTKDVGLNIYDGIAFQNFPLLEPSEDSLAIPFNGEIAVLSEDAQGRIWVGTDIGVFIISIKNKQTILLPIKLDSGECLSIVGITPTRNGNMWMISKGIAYLIKVDTQLNAQFFPSPASYAEGNTWLLEDKNGLIWSRGQKAGTLVKTSKQGLQTVVDIGLSAAHVEAAMSPENLTDWILSEGYLGVGVGVDVDVDVKQYFYESNWFKILIVCLILVIIGSFLYQSISNRRRIDAIRQKLASDLHDDVGSTLNGIYKIITKLKKRKKETNIDADLDTIAKLGNSAVNSMSDVIWSIKNDSSTFQKLLERIEDFADDIFPALAFEYTIKSENIKANAIIDDKTKYQLLLICKEGFNNVIKHSLEGKVELILKNEHKQFVLHMKNEYPQKMKPRNSSAIGLKSIKKRAAILNANVQFEEKDYSFSMTLKMNPFF